MEKIVIKKDIRKEEKVEAKDEKESLLANVFRYHCSTNIDAFDSSNSEESNWQSVVYFSPFVYTNAGHNYVKSGNEARIRIIAYTFIKSTM